MTTQPSQNDGPPKDAGYLRAAVVQLGFHPAFTPSRARSMVEDPLGGATLAVGVGHDALTSANDLRRRIATVYEEQLRLKVVAILEWCAEWNVDVVVFPEYSLPPHVLPDVARAGGAMVVVAGSHLVDRATLREDVYKVLGPVATPALNTAVCPVFSNGKLIACVPKLHPSPIDGESEVLEPGTNWRPVVLPEGTMGTMGVLLCVDFIDTEDERVANAVSSHIGSVGFWAVPSYTPQTHDFHEHASKQAARYKRPTLFANGFEKGGSGVFVDTRAPNDTGLPWRLSAKEEGVLVVDVDLRDVPPGKSTAYGARAVSRVVAAPSLVYKSNHHDAVYAEWLESVAGSGSDIKRLDRAASSTSKVGGFLERGALPPTRKRRLEQFASTADSLSKISELESLTAEIILPPKVLPLNVLEAALCRGARAVVRAWPPGTLDQTEGAEIDRKLVAGSEPLEPGHYAPSTAQAKAELKRIVDDIRGDAPLFDEPRQMALQLELYSTELQGEWKRDFDEAQEFLNAERYDAAAERIERLAQAIRAHLEKAPEDEDALAWMARVQLLRSLLHFNCQEREQARDALQKINPEQLVPNEWLNLARIYAELEEVEEAKKWISRAEAAKGSDIDPKRLTITKQIVTMKSGTMPPEPLVEEPDVLLRAAELSLEQGALAQGVQYASQAVLEETNSPMKLAGAFSVLVRALHWSIFELAQGAQLLTPLELETAIASAEHWLERLEQPSGGLRDLSLPVSIVDQLEVFRSVYYFATADPDCVERRLKRSASEDPNLARAFELARDGRTDEALALLPKTENPWLLEAQRADFFSISGSDDKALVLLRELAMAHPGRGPIELSLAERELRSGSPKSALEHAERAHERVPARGYRWLLARCLFQAGSLERAWDILNKELTRGGWNVIQLLARISATVHPAEAPMLWAKLVERNPENIQVRLALAESQSQLGHTEQAASTAWSAFERYDTKFTLPNLILCAEFQLAHDPAGLGTIGRVRRIAKLLHERFAGDPHAESYKLHLSLRLGDDPELPHTDFGVLEEQGLVQSFSVDDLLPMLQERKQRSEATTRLYAAGAIPLATLVAHGNQTAAELIGSIFDGTGPKICAAMPPSGTPSSLSDIEILAIDVELLAIAKLGLTRPLADAMRRGRSTLILPDTYYHRLVASRTTLQQPAASELVRVALELMHTGESEGWARISTWIDVQEGLREPPIPEKPKLRESELGDQVVRWRAMLEEPVHEVIDLAAAVLASPKRWRLAIDFFGTWSPGTPELMRFLAWQSSDHALKTSWFLRAAGRRCITMPTLARLLSDHRAADPISQTHERLARSGFPDALNGTELVEHARASAEVRLPKEALSGLENMALQDDTVVAIGARGHLQDTYAEAIAQAFLGEWRSEELPEAGITVVLPMPAQFGGPARSPLPLDRAHRLATGLLERLETLDIQGTTQLQAVMARVLLHALRDPRDAVAPNLEHQERALLSLDSPVGRLIDTMRSWSGPSGSRWAAWGRALRESCCIMDSFAGPGGPTTPQIAALLLASSTSAKRGESSEPERESQEQLNTLETPVNEALAILSANWKERPLNRRGLNVQLTPGSDREYRQVDWESLLAHAASTLVPEEGSDKTSIFDEREFRSSLPVPDAGGRFPIELPVEAVLLRAPPDIARWALGRLSELQGRHDGKAYELLNRIHDAPKDPEPRAEYTRHTVMAPWRLVRDDPAFLARWPQSHTTTLDEGFPQLGDLLSMLHEPTQPVGAVPGAMELIETRFAETWRDLRENVRAALYWQVRQLPGTAAVHVLTQKQDVESLTRNVEAALQHFDQVHEVPASWLAQDIMVLRMAMLECPVLSLARGTVDLRELVPSVIAKIVSAVSNASPPAGTMAGHEATLLRVCGSVCGRFFRHQSDRGQADWLWLTYRLHAWFATQMSETSSSVRRDGIEALARLAPPPTVTAPNVEPMPDLFDPRFFEARGFSYRLATVLFALIASDEWARDEVTKSESNKASATVSTPGLERQLMEHAAQLPPNCEQAGSWFHWSLPSNSADLALVVLARLNNERIPELPDESLIGRIEAWPTELSILSNGQRICIHDLVVALSYHMRNVRQAVRTALEAKLLEFQDSEMASSLKWLGLTSLFGAGASHLREAVWPLVSERHLDPKAPFVLSLYLEGVAHAGGSLEGEVDRLSGHWKDDPSAGPNHLALAIARLIIHAAPEVQEKARALLVALAGRPEFVDSSLLQELVKHFRLSTPESGQ